MKQLILIICGFWAIASFGQIPKVVVATFDLDQVAMFELFPNNSTVTLSLVTKEAGEKAIVETTNNEKWIHFSSAVEGNSRRISVKIDGGQVPSGIFLKLSTSDYIGADKIGKGGTALGSPVGLVTLSNNLQPIITNIRGAYTGRIINTGYKLTYSLDIYDYALLDFNQTETLSIALTLYDE